MAECTCPTCSYRRERNMAVYHTDAPNCITGVEMLRTASSKEVSEVLEWCPSGMYPGAMYGQLGIWFIYSYKGHYAVVNSAVDDLELKQWILSR